MGEDVTVDRVVIYNRQDYGRERLSNSDVMLLNGNDLVLATYTIGDASSISELIISASDFTVPSSLGGIALDSVNAISVKSEAACDALDHMSVDVEVCCI